MYNHLFDEITIHSDICRNDPTLVETFTVYIIFWLGNL